MSMSCSCWAHRYQHHLRSSSSTRSVSIYITLHLLAACKRSLVGESFFVRDGQYLCANDYREKFGVRCAACQEWVEGEVSQALGHSFHRRCFLCFACRSHTLPLPSPRHLLPSIFFSRFPFPSFDFPTTFHFRLIVDSILLVDLIEIKRGKSQMHIHAQVGRGWGVKPLSYF